MVYTDKNGVLTLFNTTNITPTDLGLTSTDTTTRNAIVNWVLGTDQTAYKSRQYGGAGSYWILGDIVYSTPVVVVPPSLAAVPSKTKAIINSTETAVVAPPSNLPSNAVFKQFFLDWRQCDPYNTSLQLPSGVTCPGTHVKYRDKVVYVGANDGMVHAFLLSVYDSANQWWAIYPNPTSSSDTNSWNSSTTATDKARIQQIGQELWAYIPSNLLDQLPALANQTYGSTSGSNVCSHRFMVDLAETAPTVFFGNEFATKGSQSGYWPWHIVLLGGEREGGDTYFALDVTDPLYVDPVSNKPAPKLLWEYSVFKDIITTFDLNDAAYSFTSACATKVAPTPSSPGSCQAPQFSSTYWTGSTLCGGCASSCASGSISSCVSPCLTQLKQALPGSAAGAAWEPFLGTAYSTLKTLPVSWSKPYVGRVGLPSNLTLSTCTGSTPTGTEAVCAPPSTCSTTLSGVRNLAFIGGGAHVYDASLFTAGSGLFPSSWSQFYIDGFKHSLNRTFLLALDIETGVNAFKYIWPSIYNVSRALFPEQDTVCDSNGQNCKQVVPYAMSDPIALDLWDLRNVTQGEDGYTDSIYVGDMNGVFYGLKLNFDPLQHLAGSNYGIYVDIWRTKPIPVNSTTTQDRYSDWFRSGSQPLTIQPAGSWERFNTNAFRVITAGGKYENITGSNSDFWDVARMSLYNLRDTIQFDQLGGTSWTVNANSSTWALPVTTSPPVFDSPPFVDPNLTGLGIYVRSNCEPIRTTYRCIGATDATTPLCIRGLMPIIRQMAQAAIGRRQAPPVQILQFNMKDAGGQRFRSIIRPTK
ncbi:MAG: hypothetical protein ACLQPD_02215 [Desulfomonilaceae bacterium]